MNSPSARSTKPSGHYSEGGFWALIATQFQGAFNDNAFKVIVVFLIPLLAKEAGYPATAMAFLIFNIPFLLFPSYAGYLADRFSKQRVAVFTKYWEVLVMGMGLVAFLLNSPTFLWVTLFLMAAQSAFFSPAKYGILPEILREERLSWGNGVLQLGTMLAIILGTAVATPLVAAFKDRAYLTSVVLIGFSIAGVVTSYFITKPPPAAPGRGVPWNPWAGIGRCFHCFRADRWLFLTMLGIGYFWFAGVLAMQNIIELAKATVASTALQGQLLTALSLGIGLGSVATGFLSRGKIEVGLIPLGGLGLAVFSALLGIGAWSFWGNLGLLFGLGFFGGFFIIPLDATLQQRSPKDMRGDMIATCNFVTFAGMTVSAVLFYVLFNRLGLSTSTIFLLSAAMSVVASIYICTLLPIFLLRFILWCFASTFYRIRVMGRDNIPDKGGALFVANHTSYVDALMILASTGREVRFLMYKGIYDSPFVRPLARLMGVIPIAADQSPREMVKSLHAATAALQAGEVVGIFAEGQITRTGQLLPFRKGFEHIVKGVDAPIIPVHLGNLWGSIFSFSGGRFLWKIPTKIPYPVTVSYGAPLPSDSSATVVRRAIQELGTKAFAAKRYALLHRTFARRARRRPFKQAVADGLTPRMTYFKTLAASLVLARKLNRALAGEKMVGVLLPPSVGGALVNIALQWLSKIPVNLNYTASAESLESACRQCDIHQVISSEAFLEKVKMDSPRPTIFLERLRSEITLWNRCVGFFWAACFPNVLIERLLGAPGGRSEEDLATVVFSSGSEGEPKGVMLTHRNLASNIEATLQVFPHDPNDCIMGVLPFFHSMGFLGTLWLPLTSGTRAVYHPNPLDARVIGGLTYKHKATFFMITSTLLQGFIRQCLPEHLSSLKYIVCGAEKLADRVREACKEKFGIEPIEGYGATECSPLVSLNVPNLRIPGFFQRGTKIGTIGHPIPGVSVRIVDPENHAPLGVNESGMMLVEGPNIMQGYLGRPDKTASVLRDGWYETGDIASVDEDGFITITGRLSRFSKIAGEMIPHGKVEESLHQLLGLTEQVLAVVGLPDEKKGEKLVVLHTLDEKQVGVLQEKLKQSNLPNLWVPAPNAFYRIDAIPVLGSGKMDLRSLKTLAEQIEKGF
jgi:acyl-[acyl-carrier-protein]-phospholipid O-acyltransferase/long-chain-fatty-acid--[acyl-carrier-protein] ligase